MTRSQTFDFGIRTRLDNYCSMEHENTKLDIIEKERIHASGWSITFAPYDRN